jgi:hypothetical protein
MIAKTLPAGLTENEQYSSSMNVMMMIGFGSLITVLTGYIYDKYGNKPTVFFNLFLMTLTTMNIYVFIF